MMSPAGLGRLENPNRYNVKNQQTHFGVDPVNFLTNSLSFLQRFSCAKQWCVQCQVGKATGRTGYYHIL